MSDRLQELAVFVRAAESGSFSRAARELGLSQPSVSRIVGELEARLGVTLLLRTTRRITVTDAGALFLDRARAILAEIEDAEDAARGVDSLRGIIRLALPVTLRDARDHSTPAEVSRPPSAVAGRNGRGRRSGRISSRKAPMSPFALASWTIPDSVRASCRRSERMLVASPAYLKARGTPKTPADLASHDCIFGPGNFGRDSWSFTRNGTETSVDVRGRIHTNSGPGVFASVMAGLGIAMASTVMAGRRSEGGPAGAAAARLQARTGGRARGVSRRPAPVDKGPRAGRFSGAGTQIGRDAEHRRRNLSRKSKRTAWLKPRQ